MVLNIMIIWAFLFKTAFAEVELVRSLPWDEYLILSIVAFILVLFAGLMSGLTVGLMSIDELFLEMKLSNGTEEEQRQARRILPIVNRHHILLVTLLLANSIAMEALPIVLDEMLGQILAVLLSVTFVFIFGEVLPQALCTGPDQLKIACKLAPFVQVAIFVFFPLSYPIAKILDKILGTGSDKIYQHKDLKALVTMYGDIPDRDSIGLEYDQIKIINGAIDLHSEYVKTHMIPIENAFYVDASDVINNEFLRNLVRMKFSSVLVYDQDMLLGLLKIRRLLGIDEGVTIKDSGISLMKTVFVNEMTSILDLLGILKQNNSDFAVVRDMEDKVIGIITMADVLNKVLKTDLQETENERHSMLMNRITEFKGAQGLTSPLLGNNKA